MNITRLNYGQSLPLITNAINQAHFMAFDLEMTGIANEELLNPSIIDSMQLRYEKQKQSVNKYIPLQFGLSTFTVYPELNKIVARPFNFYIFPLTLANEVMRFSFHAGTMNFLTKNNFDFNKLFYEGIPYTSDQQLRELKKKDKIMDYKRSMRKLQQISSPQSKAFIAINLPKVEQWMKSTESTLPLEIGLKFVKYQSYMNLKQKIQHLYPQIDLSFTFDSDTIHRRSKMIISRGKTQQNTESQLGLNCEVEEDYLFNSVVNLMADAKKPIIVHNGFLDLMHVYFRFYGSLPNKWHSYKEQLNTLFPDIYDNKYFFNESPTLRSFTTNQQTSLENCYVGMRQQQLKNNSGCRIEIDQNFTQYKLDSLQCHEAGFDALMTGYSFLRGATTLKSSLSTLTNPKSFAEYHKLLKNRIPQGSIKIPFNLESEDADIYTKDGNQPIYFRSILNQKIEQTKIQEYFSRLFGPVNFLWSNFNMTEFCVIFLSQNDEEKFKNTLKYKSGQASGIVTEIENTKFLVLNNTDYQSSITNMVQNEKVEVESS